ncbi:MAG TPA: HAD family phosphatase [Acidobacteriaceae bacterium]|nr:HAD family phosphatase [Acidobacteriaceae bacterium]
MPDPAPFDAILFDIGGVFLTNGWDHTERAAVLAQFSLDREAFEARHPGPNDELERDLITLDEYLDKTVFYEPRSFTHADFFQAMKGVSTPLAPSNAISVLKDLAATRKYLLGILSNESRALHSYRMEHFGLGAYLDLQLSSAYLGLRKPEAAIYRRAIDIVGRSAARILFIDDRLGNTEAAQAAGMSAIQFHSEEQLRGELRELQVL